MVKENHKKLQKSTVDFEVLLSKFKSKRELWVVDIVPF